MAKVALVKEADRALAVRWALALLGEPLEGLVSGKEVLIKVNLAVAAPPQVGATCDPELALALARECREAGARGVAFADGSAVPMEEVLALNPIRELAQAEGFAFLDLDKSPHLLVPLKDGLAVDGYILAEPVLKAEVLIDLAKLKTHGGAGVTLSMKNLMGCILGGGTYRAGRYEWADYSDRLKIHTTGFQEALVDLNRLIHPHLFVIDGIMAQEGNSPFQGELVEMGILIAGLDRVAVDATGARSMGIDPDAVGHIRLAAELGLGDPHPEVLGEDLGQASRRFKLPSGQDLARWP